MRGRAASVHPGSAPPATRLPRQRRGSCPIAKALVPAVGADTDPPRFAARSPLIAALGDAALPTLEPFVSFPFILPPAAAFLEPANLAGFVALGSSITWPLLRDRRAILGVQVLGSLLFGLHYLLLGAATAAAMCVMGALQGVALVILMDRRKRVGVVTASLLLSALVTAFTWAGLPSLLSQAGQALSAIGRLQFDTQRLRKWFLVSVVFWSTHNVMVGSVFGLASDTLSLTSLLLALWRHRAGARAARLRDATA
nr:YgjV family protein [Neoroseomonas eburnea]